MQKRKIKRLDHSATAGQGKESTKERAGRKGYSGKSGKASSRSRGRGRRAGGGRKRQRGQRPTAYKIADLVSSETIKKLEEMKR